MKEFLEHTYKNTSYLLYLEFASILLKDMRFEEAHKKSSALKNLEINFSEKLSKSLGICYPENRKIVLNLKYFKKKPQLIPYTLFHELVHQFLFDVGRPWHHTKEFYRLMGLFPQEKYPIDKNAFIHAVGKSVQKEQSLLDSIKDWFV